MFGHDVDTGWIADEYYAVAELVGMEVEVEYCSVGIDDQL